jgi:hypothetical protein
MVKEILELNYYHKGNAVLFKCVWVDSRVHNIIDGSEQMNLASPKLILNIYSILVKRYQMNLSF